MLASFNLNYYSAVNSFRKKLKSIVFGSFSFVDGLAKSGSRFRICLDSYNANPGKSKTEGERQTISNRGQIVDL